MIVVTYNVHCWAGIDGRRDSERVAEVIAALEPDVVALQEVWSKPGSPHDPVHSLGTRLGMDDRFGPTRRHRDRWFGNAVLSKWPITSTTNLDLTIDGNEPREALICGIEHEEGAVTLASTHLGLGLRERWLQVGTLCECLDDLGHGARVAAGDFNTWVPYRDADRALSAHFGPVEAFRTYPAPRPLLRLDRVYATGGLEPVKAWVPRDHRARIASDHLPVATRLVFRPKHH